MKLSELFSGIEITSQLPDSDIDITAIYADSRECTPNSLFVAISGKKTRGGDFIFDAYRRGACVFVADEKIETLERLQS